MVDAIEKYDEQDERTTKDGIDGRVNGNGQGNLNISDAMTAALISKQADSAKLLITLEQKDAINWMIRGNLNSFDAAIETALLAEDDRMRNGRWDVEKVVRVGNALNMSVNGWATTNFMSVSIGQMKRLARNISRFGRVFNGQG